MSASRCTRCRRRTRPPYDRSSCWPPRWLRLWASTSQRSGWTAIADILIALAGIAANDPLDALLAHRPQAKGYAQLSFEALLEPSEPAGFSHLERYAVAAFTAGLLGAPAAEEFYRDLLRDEDESASWAIAELLDEAVAASVPDTGTGVPGPYGIFESAALAGENAPGPWFTAT